ncbi:unnamed protein product [Acanthoscelides obtectus]|uniref:Uncharacterized protein n=1 Tax=Acanthoscelides obtectus TaxID=200917 RepID=A0A9P0NYH6_ACAOB|nr:unnamed protein product [Acanthoscelides obtectus]CAK1625216.1 hypothetical protein AOBTE_LOCUS3039 [Acanthoscelides obtectus]
MQRKPGLPSGVSSGVGGASLAEQERPSNRSAIAKDFVWIRVSLENLLHNVTDCESPLNNQLPEHETVLRVYDLEKDHSLKSDVASGASPCPLTLLFPDVSEDEVTGMLKRQEETVNVTKMLTGKRPDLRYLKPSLKLNVLGEIKTVVGLFVLFKNVLVPKYLASI